jgi:hypothetical protein
MKLPARELVIVLAGLVVLAGGWTWTYLSARGRWRGRPAGAAVSAGPTEEEKASPDRPSEAGPEEAASAPVEKKEPAEDDAGDGGSSR